jgi:2,4-dienoyl-CoA reductase-like NADH-dependent reductase (Old Yellow Enzyme family)
MNILEIKVPNFFFTLSLILFTLFIMPSSTTPALFTPLKLGHHDLKHRIVMAPLTRLRASPAGVPSEHAPEYYAQRATEGGLLITEATGISPDAGAYSGSPSIHSNEQIEEWKKTTEAVHKVGGVIFLQIWHLGRASFSSNLRNGGPLVSASDIAIEGASHFGPPYEKPRALTVDDIKSVVDDFAQAAKNAIAAGFDGKI